MDSKEFRRRINIAEDELKFYIALCSALQFNVSIKSRIKFVELFRPWYKLSDSYWYGKPSEKNIPKRRKKLREFEQICLDRELYKDF